MSETIRVAIVGASGLVGREMIDVLRELDHQKKFEALLFASTARPEEKILELKFPSSELAACRYILNAATNEVAALLAENLSKDQYLIDNSSQFRMDPAVPLMVPEINVTLLEAGSQVIANPNCTAILLCLGLFPFLDVGISRVVVSTYQAASGAGIKGLEELRGQMKAVGLGLAIPKPEVFPHVLVGNVLSHNTPIRATGRVGEGYNEEEWKVIEESRKILGQLHLSLSATCVRVPVERAHTETVSVDLKEELSLEEIRERFSKAKGIIVVDDPKLNHFPMPCEAEHTNLVRVGRIRKDATLAKTFHFMLAGDQLRKGAALNAVQIMLALDELISARKDA